MRVRLRLKRKVLGMEQNSRGFGEKLTANKAPSLDKRKYNARAEMNSADAAQREKGAPREIQNMSRDLVSRETLLAVG